MAAVALGGILLLLDHERVSSFLFLGVAAALIPLSFLPNLVVAENTPAYRVQVSLASLLALDAFLGGLGIWLALRDWLEPLLGSGALAVADKATLAAGVVFVAAGAFVAAKNVKNLIVEPQRMELRLIRERVAALPDDVERVGFVQIAWTQGLTKPYSDEFLASSARPWTAEPPTLRSGHDFGLVFADEPR